MLESSVLRALAACGLAVLAQATTRAQWASDFLGKLGADASHNNLVAVVGWIQAEGSPCSYNPLDTTLPYGGSHACNSVGVQDYNSEDDGATATMKTISVNAYGYPAIVDCFKKSCDPVSTGNAIASSSWGTGELAVECIKEAASDPSVYNQWAGESIHS